MEPLPTQIESDIAVPPGETTSLEVPGRHTGPEAKEDDSARPADGVSPHQQGVEERDGDDAAIQRGEELSRNTLSAKTLYSYVNHGKVKGQLLGAMCGGGRGLRVLCACSSGSEADTVVLQAVTLRLCFSL